MAASKPSMTARQFLAAIRELGLETPYQTAPKLGVSLAQAHRYANGSSPIPRTIELLLKAYKRLGSTEL